MPPEIFAHQTATTGSQAHEFQRLVHARLLLTARQIIKFSEDEKILVSVSEPSMDTDSAPNTDSLGGY
jgi:hypothetical protein